MFRATLSISLLVIAVSWSAPAHVQEGPAFKAVSVDLPSGDAQFPGGAEADTINNNCLACHSADMVLNQPSFPRAVWDAEVHKMIKVYRAPIDEADAARIIDYLANTKGTN
ncbi:sulfite:cytochrome C oxidoreductase subunit b precursor [Bradyrhizobium sp. ARR65]|uniref:sulfite:cytochrome C oxidoreductase subunit b precursor n=1 Tax=Bradyrhizobium sp. ARR65 TaxID=1040989 RepID=UPI0005596F6B|nr:sulfite:cytochrome C oxidoreductase subunit b precursor [Bradyrhizobium sp. ARR65]